MRFEAWNSWFNEIVAFDRVRIWAGEPEVAPGISIRTVPEGIAVEFTGTLQASESLTGGWSDLSGVTSPHVIAPGATLSAQFFRVRPN